MRSSSQIDVNDFWHCRDIVPSSRGREREECIEIHIWLMRMRALSKQPFEWIRTASKLVHHFTVSFSHCTVAFRICDSSFSFPIRLYCRRREKRSCDGCSFRKGRITCSGLTLCCVLCALRVIFRLRFGRRAKYMNVQLRFTVRTEYFRTIFSN